MKPFRNNLSSAAAAHLMEAQPLVPVVRAEVPAPIAQPQKRCGRCKACKERAQFNANVNSLDGLQHWCRECTSVYLRARREATRAKPLASAP